MVTNFRDGTTDKSIFDEVVTSNCYTLPDKFNSSDVIVDIGSHIGCFTHACLLRGATIIYALEANFDNYQMFIKNFEQEIKDGVVIPMFRAAWNNDDQSLNVYESENDPTNTGASGAFRIGKRIDKLPATIKLDTLINTIPEVRLVKLDCEGAEFKIMEACFQMRKVEEFVGEYHNIPSAGRIGDLLQKFKDNGFVVSFVDNNYAVGSFKANRV